jgi:sirohydrochlorin cobaltochelatase
LLADAAVWERVVRDVLAGLPGRGESGDVVVLAAHGSPDPRGAASFRRAAEACRRIDARLFLGMMIGSPSLDDVLRECRQLGAVRVWLAPCLVAAGYSVSHEIAGDGKDSWKSRFEQAGMHVLLVPRGLGEHDGVVSLWMEDAGRLIDE